MRTSLSPSELDRDAAASGYVDTDTDGGGGADCHWRGVLDYRSHRDHRRGSFAHPRWSSYPGARPPSSCNAPRVTVGSRPVDDKPMFVGEGSKGDVRPAGLRLQPLPDETSYLQYPAMSTPTRVKRMKLLADGGGFDDVINERLLPAPWPSSTGGEHHHQHDTPFWAAPPSLRASDGGWCGRADPSRPSTLAPPQGGGCADISRAYSEPSICDREFHRRDDHLSREPHSPRHRHWQQHDRQGHQRSASPPASTTITPSGSGGGGGDPAIHGSIRPWRSGDSDALRSSSPLPGPVELAAPVGFEAPAFRDSFAVFCEPLSDSGRNRRAVGGSVVVSAAAGYAPFSAAAVEWGRRDQRR